MDRHVIIEKVVSQAIGSLALSREVLVRMLATVHSELAGGYDQIRDERDPEDEDCCRYSVRFAAGDRWHQFYFRVNDRRSPDHLFVETIDYESRPGA